MTDTPSITDAKIKMRQHIRSLRKSLKSTADHQIFSQRTCQHLGAYFANQSGKKIASYVAIGSELDLSAFHDLAAPGKLYLPTVKPGSRVLSFLQFDRRQALVPGPHGTLQPPPNNAAALPDIVLVPLTAYDIHGNRLGQGGGYYDATLAALKLKNPNTAAIGVAFSMQEVDAIPCHSHDVTLDAIATENGLHYT